MTKAANALRSPTPTFQVNDWVLLRSDNVATTRPSKKLDDKNIGPFRITHVLGSHNYRLDMKDRRTNPSFHVDRLITYSSPETYSGRPRLSRPPPDIQNPEHYEVSEIVDSRRFRKKLQFFVRWEGYGNEDMQWVNASDFDHDDDVVLAFARRNLDKPVPYATRQTLMVSLSPPSPGAAQRSYNTVMVVPPKITPHDHPIPKRKITRIGGGAQPRWNA